MTEFDKCEVLGNCICPVWAFLFITNHENYRERIKKRECVSCLEFCCCWIPCIPLPFTRYNVLEARGYDVSGWPWLFENCMFTSFGYMFAFSEIKSELHKLPDKVPGAIRM